MSKPLATHRAHELEHETNLCGPKPLALGFSGQNFLRLSLLVAEEVGLLFSLQNILVRAGRRQGSHSSPPPGAQHSVQLRAGVLPAPSRGSARYGS